ncbi:hypothetical protein [Chlorogloeopsis sp. ULAP01]|nr:hypothetical protein [Chlorogloeopsis sp. ULAP01]
MRVPRVVDALRAASRRVAPGVTWRGLSASSATAVGVYLDISSP